MYYRTPDNRRRVPYPSDDVAIPENYSGNVFHKNGGKTTFSPLEEQVTPAGDAPEEPAGGTGWGSAPERGTSEEQNVRSGEAAGGTGNFPVFGTEPGDAGRAAEVARERGGSRPTAAPGDGGNRDFGEADGGYEGAGPVQETRGYGGSGTEICGFHGNGCSGRIGDSCNSGDPGDSGNCGGSGYSCDPGAPGDFRDDGCSCNSGDSCNAGNSCDPVVGEALPHSLPKPPGFLEHFSLPHALGSEELLLLGLMYLTSQKPGDDLWIYLLVLLFCG